MPDPDPPISSEPSSATRNLPVPVTRPSPVARQTGGDGWLRRALRTILGFRSSTVRANLKDVLEDGAGETGFSPTERTMLRNILGLRERRVADVMVPRADIIAVQRDIALGELMKVFESAGHSRLVVYDETLDDAVGMVHIRDLVAFMTERAAASAKANTRRKRPFPAGLDLKAVELSMPLSAAKIIREILYAPPSMPVLDLLAKMQTTRIHLALVVDEYGGVAGLLTIEDVIEQIVGGIEDEHDVDEDENNILALGNDQYTVRALTPIEGFNEEIGSGLSDEEFDTIGGLVMSSFGHLPKRDEVAVIDGYRFKVLRADNRRIHLLHVTKAPAEVPADNGGSRTFS